MSTTPDKPVVVSVDKSCTARSMVRLRRENALLRDQLAKFAALVDHYYSAYRDAQSLVERRDRELATLRRRIDSAPVSLTRPRP